MAKPALPWVGVQPGDVLIYAGNQPTDLVIKAQTWSRYTHCEVLYRDTPDGELYALASRFHNTGPTEDGVDRYRPNFPATLARVLRPPATFDARAAYAWFQTVRGQPYDWLGLLNFTLLKVTTPKDDRQFCSEFVVNYLRHGGVEMAQGAPADTLSPRDIAISDALTLVWADRG